MVAVGVALARRGIMGERAAAASAERREVAVRAVERRCILRFLIWYWC